MTHEMHATEGLHGWRARVGVVVPSPNTVLEPLYNKYVPDLVSVHFARMFIEGVGAEFLKEMDRTSGMVAVRDVNSCGVNVVLYACTASSVVQPPGYDEDLIRRITDLTGKPATTVTASLLAALRAYDATKVVIVSPYADDVEQAERQFFESAGVRVLASQGMGIVDPRGLAAPDGSVIAGAVREIWDPAADALVLGCANFRSHEVIEDLEAELGVPVLTSTQAPLWQSLRLAGIEDRVEGLGMLFRDF